MTPTNPLDGKFIVNKQDLRELLALAAWALPRLQVENAKNAQEVQSALLLSKSIVNPYVWAEEAFKRCCSIEKSQDNTGWAAVPVVLNGCMFNASRVDCPMALTAPIGVVAQLKWAGILEASPPLGGGE